MEAYASGPCAAEAMRRCFSKPLDGCEEPDKTASDVELWKDIPVHTKSTCVVMRSPLRSAQNITWQSLMIVGWGGRSWKSRS